MLPEIGVIIPTILALLASTAFALVAEMVLPAWTTALPFLISLGGLAGVVWLAAPIRRR
jgi:hypothetical protein